MKDQQSSLENSVEAVDNGESAQKRKTKWRNLEDRLQSKTMERGTWNSTGIPSAMPLSSFESKLFNILLTKMNMRLLLVGFIPEKT